MRRLSAPRDARWTRFAAQNRGKAMRIEKVLNNNVVVALDENGEPTEVPGLVLETEEERAEWADGERRRLMRKERRARP